MFLKEKKFFHAVKQRNLYKLDRMIARGFDVNCTNKKGITALYIAIANEDIKLIRYLVYRGADIDFEKRGVDTPLEYACYLKRYKSIKELIRLGCNVNNMGCQYAAAYGNNKLVKFLLKKGYDINWKDSEGYTALHWAVQEGHLETVKLLIENGCDINIMDAAGHTPLYVAAGENRSEIAKYLLEHNADANLNNDTSPLEIAKAFGNKEVVKVLKEYIRQNQ